MNRSTTHITTTSAKAVAMVDTAGTAMDMVGGGIVVC